MAQFITQDKRPLPALACLEATVCYGLIDFGSADARNRASFRNRKPFPLEVLDVVVHAYLSLSARTIASVQG